MTREVDRLILESLPIKAAPALVYRPREALIKELKKSVGSRSD